MPFFFQLLSANYSEKLNWSSHNDKFSLQLHSSSACCFLFYLKTALSAFELNSVRYRIETLSLSVTCSNYLPYFWFNNIISPINTKSFQASIQGFEKLFISTRLMCLFWFFTFICFVGEFTTMQDFNHTNNRGVYADAFICNSCLAALKMPLSFLLLSVNHSEKLNWSSNRDKFSLHYILPQHATSFLFENRPFRIWLKILVCLLFRMLIGSKTCCGKRWRCESAFPE